MSGVFCVYHRDSVPLQLSTLAGMGQAMAHRGPDGIHTWHDGCVGLGLCRLDTTPHSGAAQLPFMDRAAGLVITADARLDNRADLWSRLAGQGDGQQPVPDSQLILQAYRKWGTKCVDYLLGDFVFVIRDLKLQRIFCARDHLGIKPFYYHSSDRIFAGASEVRSLLKVPQVPGTINEDRIADFLVSQLEGLDKTSTFYASIQRLPPAHSLLVKPDRTEITEYWRLNPEHETRYAGDGEYLEAFQEILTNAVRVRLRSIRRPAMLLSGGIDSAAVAAFGIQSGGESNYHSPACFSAISDNAATCRESFFIDRIRRHLHINSNSTTKQSLKIHNAKLQDIFKSVEEPFDEMTVIILLYLAARENQHNVVLDGVEGDMIYSLPADYPGLLLKQGHLIRGMGEIYGCWINRYNRQYPLYQTMSDAIRPVLVPELLRKLRRCFSGRILGNNPFSDSGINPVFAKQAHLSDRLWRLHEYSKASNCKTLRELHIQNITHPYLAAGLERYDRLAALCQVEPRHPLLDKRLVEFSCSLPWEQKVRHGWPKYLLRRACQPYLPDDVVWRRGWEHLGWTYTTTWIKNNREYVTGRIAAAMPQLNKYMHIQCLNNVPGLGRDYTENEITLVWSAFLLASWLQIRIGVP